jgi:hypothetical protein
MMKKYFQLTYLPLMMNLLNIKIKIKNKRLSSLFHIFKEYKNKKSNIKLANGFRLSSIFKEYRFKDNKK